MQRILFIFQFWRVNPKAPQPAKACAVDEAAGACWLQIECSISQRQPVQKSCSWIASVSAVALGNDLALQQKLELLHQLSNIILSNIILTSRQYSRVLVLLVLQCTQLYILKHKNARVCTKFSTTTSTSLVRPRTAVCVHRVTTVLLAKFSQPVTCV